MRRRLPLTSHYFKFYSSVTMTYDNYGHLFHDLAKDVDLMGEMERALLAA